MTEPLSLHQPTIRVLVIEHNGTPRERLARLLEEGLKERLVLRSAASTSQAVAALWAESADVALLGASMATGDVPSICRRLRAVSPELPIVLTAPQGIRPDPAQILACNLHCWRPADAAEDGGTLAAIIREAMSGQRAADGLAVSAALLGSTLSSLVEGVVACDTAGQVLIVNPAARSLLGLEEDIEGAAGITAETFACYHADGVTLLAESDRPLLRALSGGSFDEREHLHRLGDGEDARLLSVSGRPLTGPAGERIGAVVSFRDVTERKRLHYELAYLSQYDSLTGVANRKIFMDFLTRAIARADRQGGRLGLLFLDLDRFKEINDSYGHAVGDELLKGVARRLTDSVRLGDVVGRLGGDEFAVLLENLPGSAAAAVVARKLLEALQEPFVFDGKQIFATPSIGIATYPESGTDPQGLLHAADQAMYKAKQDGCNTYHFYSETLHQVMLRRTALENDLKQAMMREEFSIVYQPQIDLRTGRPRGLEALLRWRHPDHGNVSPTEFIPLLESMGAMATLAEWTLASASMALAEWRQQFPALDLHLAFNLSELAFARRNLADTLVRIVRNAGLPPEVLEIEIAERMLERSRDKRVAALTAVRAEGIRIALHNLGTGPLELGELIRLPLTKLKLDRSITARLPQDARARALLEGALALTKGLDWEFVAEGVETLEQLAELELCGCPMAQGFALSVPLPARAVGKFLRSCLPAPQVSSRDQASFGSRTV